MAKRTKRGIKISLFNNTRVQTLKQDPVFNLKKKGGNKQKQTKMLVQTINGLIEICRIDYATDRDFYRAVRLLISPFYYKKTVCIK